MEKIKENRDYLTKKEAQAIYLDFIDRYELYLDNAKKILNVNSFSFSIEEIDQFGIEFEKWYQNLENITLSFDELLNTFIAYYGESWMCYFGGYYIFTLKKIYYSYGYPSLIEYGPLGGMWSELKPSTYAYQIVERGNDKEGLSRIHKRQLHIWQHSEGFSIEQMKRTIFEWDDAERKKEFGSVLKFQGLSEIKGLL